MLLSFSCDKVVIGLPSEKTTISFKLLSSNKWTSFFIIIFLSTACLFIFIPCKSLSLLKVNDVNFIYLFSFSLEIVPAKINKAKKVRLQARVNFTVSQSLTHKGIIKPFLQRRENHKQLNHNQFNNRRHIKEVINTIKRAQRILNEWKDNEGPSMRSFWRGEFEF